MSAKFMLVWSLLLKDTTSGERRLFTYCAIASSNDEALDQAVALSCVGVAGDWEIEQYKLLDIDRELIEDAAREILGWGPLPQEIEGEQ